MANRLANEKSPYLLQHALNPVDWYPWGEEALQRARTEDKPILVSIGYSACHWCHVMAHESFEDEATAALMNDRFINIKVDREERPDVDAVYMEAVQALHGQGGWPLNVFLTTDSRPFYGGTYFPPTPRHGLPSWTQVLESISEAYHERREDILNNASALTEYVNRAQRAGEATPNLEDVLLSNALQRSALSFDWKHGGFGGAPKFPQPLSLDLVLRLWRRYNNDEALRFVRVSLNHMASGGIFDHLGGGFHRYAVDSAWVVPHFEKMLYDNALLSGLYVRAFQATADARYRSVAERTLDYLLRDMRSPDGAFYSAEDADSEGEEGRFYLWSPDNLHRALDADDAALAAVRYGVHPGGNFEGKTILTDTLSADQVAQQTGVPIETLSYECERIRAALWSDRETRVRPAKDTKIVTSWNALAITSLALAGRVFDRQDYLNAAQTAMSFIIENLFSGERLLRSYKDGPSSIPGFLEDYSFALEALLVLYQTCFDPHYLERARRIASAMIALFWDEDRQCFFDTGKDAGDLFVRPRTLVDNPIPSGSSSAVSSLLTLDALTGDIDHESYVISTFRAAGLFLERSPLGFSRLLCALDTYLSPRVQIAITGDPSSTDTADLVRVAFGSYLPQAVVAVGSTDSSPLLNHRVLIDGKATAYVCQNFACRLPVTDEAVLQEELLRVEAGVSTA